VNLAILIVLIDLIEKVEMERKGLTDCLLDAADEVCGRTKGICKFHTY